MCSLKCDVYILFIYLCFYQCKEGDKLERDNRFYLIFTFLERNCEKTVIIIIIIVIIIIIIIITITIIIKPGRPAHIAHDTVVDPTEIYASPRSRAARSKKYSMGNESWVQTSVCIFN